jgi:tetratricopeptide (TPR) repeat protein
MELLAENGVTENMLDSALAHHRAGRLAEAETIYRQILATDSRHADSLHLLGMIEHQRGNHEAAVQMIQQAIAISPDEAAYHSNLGTIYQAQGKLNEAATCLEHALRLKPDWAEVHSNLGNVLQTQNKLEEAAACQERALALKPDFAEAFSNLGNIRQAQGRLDDAVACYQNALALKPGYPDAHNNLGNALATLGKTVQAVAHYESALALRPDWPQAHNNLGNALASVDRTVEATGHYHRALALKPDYANAHHNLGNVLKEQGRFDEAVAHYGHAIALKPDYGEAHLSRAEIKSFQPGDADLEALQTLAQRADLPADKAPYIHFALAKALDDVGDYCRAFEHLRTGNRLKRHQIHYDEKSALELFERVSSVFDSSLFERFGQAGDPSSRPIFILGMPRSGSTLLEQILAGHPQIHAAGEVTALEQMEWGGIFNSSDPPLSYPESIPKLDREAFRRFGQTYLSRLPKVSPEKLRIVDKLPGNFLRIGLIRLILPNARIIHTVRNPIDTCLSCYSKLFTFGLYFTYDLAELGRYYRAYSNLMDHWRSVLPRESILDVSYEDVVDDLEGQARRLIDYCGLPWDDRCLNFHETGRHVKTASSVQVRRPLYRTSVERWRRYEAGLRPLLDELASV